LYMCVTFVNAHVRYVCIRTCVSQRWLKDFFSMNKKIFFSYVCVECRFVWSYVYVYVVRVYVCVSTHTCMCMCVDMYMCV
jgi:hypothetical protein